jgi:AcrR family transcriptional regulator
MNSDKTELKILYAAQELFFRYGIKRITMDDIAKHLSVSKKTIYQYFEDKNKIVDSLCAVSLTENEAKFRQIAENSKDSIHEMLEAAKYMTEIFSKINPVFFYDLQKLYPAAWKRFNDFKNSNVMSMLKDNLNAGIQKGYYRKDINVELMAKYRIIQVDLIFTPDIFSNASYSLAIINEALLDNFMHGITTLKGHRLINKYKQIQEEEE